MLEVTEAAVNALTSYLKEQNLDSPIRVYMAQGGCSGTALAMGLDDKKDSDQSFELNGLTFLVAPDLLESVGKLKVDFLTQGSQSGFQVSSEKPLPAGPSSCGSSCCSC